MPKPRFFKNSMTAWTAGSEVVSLLLVLEEEDGGCDVGSIVAGVEVVRMGAAAAFGGFFLLFANVPDMAGVGGVVDDG